MKDVRTFNTPGGGRVTWVLIPEMHPRNMPKLAGEFGVWVCTGCQRQQRIVRFPAANQHAAGCWENP